MSGGLKTRINSVTPLSANQFIRRRGVMRTVTAITCLCLFLALAPGSAAAGAQITVDGSSGGVEVTAPDEFIFHNLFLFPNYYSVGFSG